VFDLRTLHLDGVHGGIPLYNRYGMKNYEPHDKLTPEAAARCLRRIGRVVSVDA
jgi:hypothetical protein